MPQSNNVASPRLQGLRLCQTCGEKLPATKRAGRHRLFCSDKCRDARRRQLNFDFYGSTAHGQGKPRNAVNSVAISTKYEADFRGRGSAINGLRKRLIEVEIIEPRAWTEAVSTDGVRSQISILRPRALRDGGAP